MGVVSLTPQLVHDLHVSGDLDHDAVGGDLLQGEEDVEEEVVHLGGVGPSLFLTDHTFSILAVEVQTAEKGWQEGGESLLKSAPLHFNQQAQGLCSQPLVGELWDQMRSGHGLRLGHVSKVLHAGDIPCRDQTTAV